MNKINCILTEIESWNYIVFTYKDLEDLNGIEAKSIVDLHNNHKLGPISIWMDRNLLFDLYNINFNLNLADGKYFINNKTKYININYTIDIINTINTYRSFNGLIDKEELIFLFNYVMFS